MARFNELLRTAIDVAGAICALLVLAIPLWYGLAAFGTKWEFWGWETGLGVMTHVWGPRFLAAGLVAAVLAAGLMILHRLLTRQGHGNWSSVIVVALIALGGIGWAWQIDRERTQSVALLDITTDFADPPYFSTAFISRRSDEDASLVYAGKLAANGQALPALQAERFPDIAPLRLDEPADAAYARALELAREQGWRIATASSQAGMFEAGAESLWFGLRDDMVVRVRPDEAGGSVIDIRSLAREPVDDLGRNARRVQEFLAALAAG